MKSEKAILRNHWGHWAEAKARLPRSSARSIVTYLVDHPTDFRGAFARMRRELRTLYFSAFQSHLWNLMLARWIERHADSDQVVPVSLKVGDLSLPAPDEPESVRTLSKTMLALPCCRSPVPEGQLGEIVAELLKGFGL